MQFLKVSISSPLEHIVKPIIHLTRIVQFDLIAIILSTNGWLVQIEETLLTPWYQAMHKKT